MYRNVLQEYAGYIETAQRRGIYAYEYYEGTASIIKGKI